MRYTDTWPMHGPHSLVLFLFPFSPVFPPSIRNCCRPILVFTPDGSTSNAARYTHTHVHAQGTHIHTRAHAQGAPIHTHAHAQRAHIHTHAHAQRCTHSHTHTRVGLKSPETLKVPIGLNQHRGLAEVHTVTDCLGRESPRKRVT